MVIPSFPLLAAPPPKATDSQSVKPHQRGATPQPPAAPGAAPAPRASPSKPATPAPGTPGKPVAPAPDDQDQKDEETINSVVPKLGNPLDSAGTTIDSLISKRINDDVWKALRGKLQCLDTSESCIALLQQSAVENSKVLKAIDDRVTDLKSKIDLATKNHQTSINLSTFQPIAQEAVKHKSPLNFLFNLISAPLTGANTILSLIGVPLFDRAFGGTTAQQQNTIAIADLNVKVADIQRNLEQIADKIREAVITSVIDFEDAARQFQIAQEIAIRNNTRLKYSAIAYRNGEGTTEAYLLQQSEMDKLKADVYQKWSTMRGKLLRLKLLILTPTDSSDDE